MPHPPVILTERLVLRAHEAADFADSAAMWADPAVVRHIGGVPSTAEEAWSRLLRYGGMWPLLGFGYWRIGERRSDRFVGEAGLADFRRETVPRLDGAAEAGWALRPWAHGRGYAREAMAAILAWADAELDAPRTVCLIAPDNAPSLRLADRLGYAAPAPVSYKGRPSLLLERPRAAG